MRDLIALIDKVYFFARSNQPPPREYNVARRLKLIKDSIIRKNNL